MTKRLMHRLFVVILLPTILFLSYNYSVNWHEHRLDSGFLVTHAHPFDHEKLPGETLPGHRHNGVQMLALDQIFQLLTIALIVIFVSVLVKQTQFVLAIVKPHIQALVGWQPGPQLRGPPCFG